MLDYLTETQALMLCAFGGGLLLGLAARVGRFCTLGAIEDYHFGNSTTRIRMWGVALGSGIFLSFLASALGWADLEASFYLARPGPWAGAIVGGLLFGYGMALAGNCGFGALARLGGGDLRSFVIVLVMGLSALATASGPLAAVRLGIFGGGTPAPSPAGLAHALGGVTGLSVSAIGMSIGLLLTLAVVVSSPRKELAWGLVVGVAIASAFVGTSYIAANGFAPVDVVSHTFSAPLGETMVYIMLSTGVTPSFGVGSVAGVIAGAIVGSLIRGVFRWEACEDHRELRRQIFGSVLMGVGAVVAMGCSVGQGLSAFSTLAFTAPLCLGSIWLGGWIGLSQLIEGPAFALRR